MQPAGAYPLFGTTHLLTIAAMFVMGGIIVYGARRWIAPDRRKYVAISLGLFMFAQEVLDRRLHHYLGNEPWRNVLPFHLCGMSVVLTVILFITRKRSLYDLLYFWGLAGATMAILTPDIQFPFPHILNLTYFWSHALIIVGVAFMTVNYGYRPSFKSFLRAPVLTNLYMALVIPINMALGANYLYPKAKNGDWLAFFGSLKKACLSPLFAATVSQPPYSPFTGAAKPHGQLSLFFAFLVYSAVTTPTSITSTATPSISFGACSITAGVASSTSSRITGFLPTFDNPTAWPTAPFRASSRNEFRSLTLAAFASPGASAESPPTEAAPAVPAPTIVTPNSSSTDWIGFAIATVELPAYRRPTGRGLLPTFSTINEPESPALRNFPGVTMIWPVNVDT